ncbi:hypothetical protein ACFL1R_02285 [Candidatus Latescibacterota bacterium]
MKSKVIWAGIITLLVVFSPTSPRGDPSDGFLSENIDFEDIFSDLPDNFDIDTAEESDFLLLPFFNEKDAEKIISFRDIRKKAVSLHTTIDNIPGLSSLQYAILHHLSRKDMRLIVPEVSGHIRSGYAHRPVKESLPDSKYYIKLNCDSERGLSIGFLGERDPFEPKALDLSSAGVSFTGDKDRIHAVIGDYRPGFGQGLVFSRYGRSYTYGADIIVHEKINPANTFFEESRFLRGGFITIKREWLVTHLWHSVRKLDASVDNDKNVVGIRDTGYHLSGDNPGNLKERITAARFAFFPTPEVDFAFSGVQSTYSPALTRPGGESYMHYPEGSQFRYVTVDGKIEKGYARLFFEYAYLDEGETAAIGGVQLKRDRVRLGVLLRRYSEGYWAFRSGSFSAFGKTSNEEGVYSAIEADLTNNIRLVTSLDMTRTLFRTYSNSMPVSRKRIHVMIQSRLPGGLIGRISTRSTRDSGDRTGRWNMRMYLEKKRKRSVIADWRSSFAWSQGDGEGGPFADTSLTLLIHGCNALLSAGFFDIPVYGSRFYYYQRNVPGRGYTSPLWGRGGVFILFIRWREFSGRYLVKNSDLMKSTREIGIQADISF